VEKRLQSGKRGKKAIRKDAVKLVSVLVSAETAFLKRWETLTSRNFSRQLQIILQITTAKKML
ncbi:hypothetical protein, partial [Megasphaera stantonii]|uniref:hypothetical protein n=1 Tax=Megasphaera stantonii TaxID=2144175 RepID=UPI0018E56D51